MGGDKESLAAVHAVKTLPQLIRAAAAAYGDDTAIALTGETIHRESLSFAQL